ncbi:MAG: hypothetical protein M9949_14910 [Candidatus Kapabacteria bacterium]|nr:hypothetical protein [Candidatus Kapabacteria bacterium]
MKIINKTLLCLISATLLALASCSTTLTRVEKDSFSDILRDTVVTEKNINHPGNRDKGTVYPSSKVTTITNEIDLLNYEKEREYPNFIRFGLFEGVGLIGSSPSNKLGTGLFGVFPDYDKIGNEFRGEDSYLFAGGLYRVGIFEWRLRWFRDAHGWSIGTSMVEFILPNAKGEDMLFAVAPIYVRKRFFLRDKIPYITFTPSLGIGLYPSTYLNLSGSLDIGSIGGVNFRTYLGIAMGHNSKGIAQIKNNDFTKEAQSIIFPYFGIGVSVLDFINKAEETENEWKYHEHSSWDVGLVQFSILMSAAKYSAFQDRGSEEASTFKGMQMKVANASIALPFLNLNFFAGTSLMNFMVTGLDQYAIAVLPLKFGYWQVLIDDELSAEPSIEVGYYPSGYINLNNKVNLRISETLNINLNFGYINCFDNSNLGDNIAMAYGKSLTFSNFYIGFGVSFMDRIFFPSELRYNR